MTNLNNVKELARILKKMSIDAVVLKVSADMYDGIESDLHSQDVDPMIEYKSKLNNGTSDYSFNINGVRITIKFDENG